MGQAYENYATAITLAVTAHNNWRRLRSAKGRTSTGGWSAITADRNPQVKGALTKATNAAMLREDAKARYRASVAAARRAGVSA